MNRHAADPLRNIGRCRSPMHRRALDRCAAARLRAGGLVRRLAAAALALAMSLALADCAVGPDFQRPAAPTAQRYTAPSGAGGADPGATSQPAPAAGEGAAVPDLAAGPAPARWWTQYGSSELDAWVGEAQQRNPDLQSLVATLAAARSALAAQEGASSLPTVGGALQYGRQRALGLPAFGPATVLYELYAAVVQVSYDLDLFGGVRRQNEASRAEFDAQDEELAAARQTLAANVVVTAIRSAAFTRRVEVQQSLVGLAGQRAQMVERRHQLGAASHREALEARRAADDLAATLPPLQAQRERNRHALAILLGRGPADAPADLDLDALRMPASIPVAVPSELVRTRPDVLAAEARLHAATARVGVATANLYPHLTLTATYGSESFHRASFLKSPSGIWSASGSLLQPIFQGGALTEARRAAAAEVESAWQRYQATVLKAFGNVGDSLRAVQEDGARLARATAAEADAGLLVDEMQRRRREGSESALSVLGSEQALRQEVLARLDAQEAGLADAASLFLAVGAPVPAPAPSTRAGPGPGS